MNDAPSFRKQFEELVAAIDSYLDSMQSEVDKHVAGPFFESPYGRPNLYWQHIPADLRAQGASLTYRLLDFGGKLAPRLKSAPLANEGDQREFGLSVKTIRAALQLRRFRSSDPDYLHDEDRVLGVRPASQSDDEAATPHEASDLVADSAQKIVNAIALVEASGELGPASAPTTFEKDTNAARYRPSTAFVMMWMDKKKPDLEDVSVAVKEVFAEFDIRAVRADDIEHEGLISQRVLNEIATSEFLFADLTGARPNVYYEVGYAHALGKRVILFRKDETSLHFDLAGYNCPAYVNNKDLKEKLRKRLIEMTNRGPKS